MHGALADRAGVAGGEVSGASLLDTAFTRQAHIEVPLIGGAMYPCGNPELVAAVSEAGGIGIVQPISLTYVHGHEYREGLQLIKSLTKKPVGMNALIEQSSRAYHERMVRWVSIALEEGIRFFVTSLGNPRWVVDAVRGAGGVVYHDVTERKWAQKGLDGGVQGLIAVNDRAGGHAGPKSAQQLMDELGDLGVPLICAGGVGDAPRIRGGATDGIRGRADGHAIHRDARVPRGRCVQAGDRGQRLIADRAHGTDHRRAGVGDRYADDPEDGTQSRPVRAMDAPRAEAEALDADDLRAQVTALAQEIVIE